MAQLEERWSHNPKVVSSILTSRIPFAFLTKKMSEQGKRDLGTVILTPSITRGEPKTGKMLPDGNQVESEGKTFSRYGLVFHEHIV